MSSTLDKYRNLDEMARKATPGPWKPRKDTDTCPYSSVLDSYGTGLAIDLFDDDAAYIAAVNPQVIQELIAELREARNILQRVSEYGPEEGIFKASTACAFCDMGGAGYSSRGDGFHDDKCAVKDAQLFLRALKDAGKGGANG